MFVTTFRASFLNVCVSSTQDYCTQRHTCKPSGCGFVQPVLLLVNIFYLRSNPLCLWCSWCSCNFPWPICLWKKHFFFFYISLYCSPSFWCCICSQKPYACQIPGCTKRYTDPSSLRKHVKAHSAKGLQEREVKVKAERVAQRAEHRV